MEHMDGHKESKSKYTNYWNQIKRWIWDNKRFKFEHFFEKSYLIKNREHMNNLPGIICDNFSNVFDDIGNVLSW